MLSHLCWGQTLASGWIFKSATFPPPDRRWQTRDPVHCCTFHTEPGRLQTPDVRFNTKHLRKIGRRPCRRWESPSVWWRCPPGESRWRPAKETSEQTWTGWRTEDGCSWSTRTFLQEICQYRLEKQIFQERKQIPFLELLLTLIQNVNKI